MRKATLSKKLSILASICFLSLVCYAQTEIQPETAAKHLGEKVTVCGRIFGGKFLDHSNSQPTLVDMGAAYPDQLLTILIWGVDRKKFSYMPETFLVGKQICVSGLLKEYHGKPEIIVTDTAQIRIRN